MKILANFVVAIFYVVFGAFYIAIYITVGFLKLIGMIFFGIESSTKEKKMSDNISTKKKRRNKNDDDFEDGLMAGFIIGDFFDD